jgi:hypothetical protein
MESKGAQPTQIFGTIHGIGYPNTGLGGRYLSPDGVTPFSAGYHTYGMIWSPFLIQFYVDSVTNIYASYTPAEIMGIGTNPGNGASTAGEWDFFAHPFYIILNVAVGGGFPGAPDASTVLPQYMNIDYVRVYQAAAPAGPTSLNPAAISNSQVQLNWAPSATGDPNLTYNVFRSTTSGAEHAISNMIATGLTGTSFVDVLLTPGTTYYYQVSASGQESGESALSNEAMVILPLTGANVQPIAISSGSLVGTQNFVRDTGYASGATNAYPTAIDVSGVTNPAPQGVYRTERWGATTYSIPNLTPGSTYTVRLHFAETAFAGVGQRAFNVTINGSTVLANYDIFADAGALLKATVKQFSATADSSGVITIAFSAGTSGAPHTNPSIRGIEIIPTVNSCSPPSTPSGFTAAIVSSTEIDLSWSAVTGPACGGAVTYSLFRNGAAIQSGLSSTTFKNTGLTAGTAYSYTLTAQNSSGSSSPASASATTLCTAPPAPASLTATAMSSSEIDLSWPSVTGPACGGSVTYTVSRNGSQIKTGLTATSLQDTGLAAATTYNYTLAAMNSAGGSPAVSASATTLPGSATIQINSGGPAVAPFAADSGFSGGTAINHANTIDLSGVSNPAPMAVYQTARIGNITYTIPGFTAGSSHTVRLHFAETYWSSAGSRIFGVSINGTPVLSNFDIFAAAGAKNKAIVKPFSATANSAGQIVIKFTPSKDNALISGIEVQ